MVTRRNALLQRQPTAGLSREQALRSVCLAKAELIVAAEKLSQHSRTTDLSCESLIRECAAAGARVVQWQDALDRVASQAQISPR